MKHVSPLELKDTGVDNDDPVAIVTKALEGFKADFGAKLKDIETKAQQRIDALEAKANRPAIGAVTSKGDNEALAVETKALNSYARNGTAGLDDIERKALNLGTGATGGYVTVPEYSRTVIEKLTQISPLRGLASVMTIGGTEIFLPALTGDADGGWVTETGARPETQPVFGQHNIKTFEFAGIVPVSAQLLEDSSIDLSGFITRHLQKRFGRAEGQAFIKGNGTTRPEGLMTTPANYDQVNAKHDGSDLLKKLIELFYSLPEEYAAFGSWLMSRQTMGKIRELADGSPANRTIWSDSLAAGTPPTLLGAPVYSAVDMDPLTDPVTPTNDTFPIAFGDFGSAYQVVDRTSFAFMRDDFTGADNGIVKLRFRRRVGGKPVLNEAVKVIKGVV